MNNNNNDDASLSLLLSSSLLEDIWMDHNNFTGPFPIWMLTQLSNLKSLIVSYNSFTGTTLSKLDEQEQDQQEPILSNNLIYLDMSFNDFSGPIPASFFRRGIQLQYLYLEHNQFEQLPSNTTGIYNDDNDNDTIQPPPPPLVDLWLHSNNLQGMIPMNFGFIWRLSLQDVRLHNNPQLIGNLSLITQGCNIQEQQEQQYPNLSTLKADCLQQQNGSNNNKDPPPVTCQCCTECF